MAKKDKTIEVPADPNPRDTITIKMKRDIRTPRHLLKSGGRNTVAELQELSKVPRRYFTGGRSYTMSVQQLWKYRFDKNHCKVTAYEPYIEPEPIEPESTEPESTGGESTGGEKPDTGEGDGPDDQTSVEAEAGGVSESNESGDEKPAAPVDLKDATKTEEETAPAEAE